MSSCFLSSFAAWTSMVTCPWSLTCPFESQSSFLQISRVGHFLVHLHLLYLLWLAFLLRATSSSPFWLFLPLSFLSLSAHMLPLSFAAQCRSKFFGLPLLHAVSAWWLGLGSPYEGWLWDELCLDPVEVSRLARSHHIQSSDIDRTGQPWNSASTPHHLSSSSNSR